MIAKHTCGGPVFGTLTAGCPRCDELAAGASPRQQAWRLPGRFSGPVTDAERAADVRMHYTSERHRSGRCGIVCTYGDS
jgi:hypothetical protein